MIVTVKLHEPVFKALSVALQITGVILVVPAGLLRLNVLPLLGTHVTAGTLPELSVAVAGFQVTTALGPELVFTT